MPDPNRLLQMYADVWAPNRPAFNRWLWANAILGSLLGLGVVAMVIAGLGARQVPPITTKLSDSFEVNASQDTERVAWPRGFAFRPSQEQVLIEFEDQPF